MLFSTPLPRPVPRLYRELQIEPDAADDEVAWAKVATTARLRREQAELRADLDDLEKRVPGLAEARERVRELRRPPDTEVPAPGALREAERRLARLQREAFRRDPLVGAKRRRADEVRQAILELAAVGLDEPEKRLAYDRAHPPLACSSWRTAPSRPSTTRAPACSCCARPWRRSWPTGASPSTTPAT